MARSRLSISTLAASINSTKLLQLRAQLCIALFFFRTRVWCAGAADQPEHTHDHPGQNQPAISNQPHDSNGASNQQSAPPGGMLTRLLRTSSDVVDGDRSTGDHDGAAYVDSPSPVQEAGF
jgi:hypothetical protein